MVDGSTRAGSSGTSTGTALSLPSLFLSLLIVITCAPFTPQAHLVGYHVVFHGATSHMEIHVVKVDKSNHDKNHVVIHVFFYNANLTCWNIHYGQFSLGFLCKIRS